LTVNPHRALRRIRRLDPARDYHEIYRHLVLLDAPDTMEIGLNMAFYRTYAVPSIARLLLSTGELAERPRKRADDTGILIYEMVIHGFDHPRGRAAQSRMNRIHAMFDIAEDDYLYVLAALVVVPVRFLDRFGWRRALPEERAASAEFYRQMGRRMALTRIPADYAEFESFLDRYEQEHFAYCDAAHRLMLLTTDFMASRFPAWAARPAAALTYSLMDAPMREALGAPTPSHAADILVQAGFRTACYVTRWLRPNARSRFPAGVVEPAPTYPNGYEIAEVGPGPRPARQAPETSDRA
jgi:hypothetical protein